MRTSRHLGVWPGSAYDARPMHRRHPSGRPLGPLGGSLIVTLVAAMLWATTGVALAASRSKPKPKPAPAAPDPGWVVDRAEFQSLEPSSRFDLPGIGSYRGSMLVRPASGGGVAAVNQVGLDDYLKGLAEVPATWPAEALKAQ